MYEQIKNPKFYRTEYEKCLSGEFAKENSELINRYENRIYNSKIFDKITDISSKIRACNNSIKSFLEFKSFCYETEGGTIYFQDHFEYCHNSKVECFSYMDRIEVELKRLRVLKNLEPDIYNILQKEHSITLFELYKHFDPSLKYQIRKILSEWESYDVIKKTPYKRTFLIELL